MLQQIAGVDPLTFCSPPAPLEEQKGHEVGECSLVVRERESERVAEVEKENMQYIEGILQQKNRKGRRKIRLNNFLCR